MKYNAVLDVKFSKEGAEVITLADVKAWSKIDVNDDDVLIGGMIGAARLHCEKYANISIVSRTVTARLRNELGGIMLPYGPGAANFSLTDEDGVALVLDTDYKLTTGLFIALRTPFCSEVYASYDTGYVPCPNDVKKAMLCQIDWMYKNRGTDTDKVSTEAATLLAPYVRNI